MALGSLSQSDAVAPGVEIVDAHVHVWSSNTLEYPFGPHDGLPVPAESATIERFFASPGTSGRAAILIQPRVYGYDHAYLYECAESLAHHVRVFPSVGVLRRGAIQELNRLAAHPLTAGFRVVALGDNPREWLAGQMAHLVWEAATSLDIPVGLLVDAQQLELVDRIASDHPDLVVIVDHMGRCDPHLQDQFGATLLGLARRSNVYVKLSAIDSLSKEEYPFADMWSLVRSLFDSFGPFRLLWGSDWPHVRSGVAYERCHMPIREALSAASDLDMESIFKDTAHRLFFKRPEYSQGMELWQ